MRVGAGIVMAVCSIVTGCAEVGQRPGHEAHVDTLESGRVVVRHAGAFRPASPAGWRLIVELEIDGDGRGSGGPPLGNVIDLAVGENGRLYVLDALAQSIVVFTPTGKFVRTTGHKGEGPGEFRGASGIGIDEDGDLWVVDPRLRRYSEFDTSGHLKATYTRPIVGGTTAWQGRITSDGVLDFGLSFPDEGPAVVAGERVLFHPLRVHPHTGQVDSFPALTFHQDMLADGSRPQPFFSKSFQLALASDSLIWSSEADEYRVHQRTLSGDTLRSIVVDIEPPPVTDDDVQALRERLGADTIQLGPYLADLPESKSVIEGMAWDPAGYLYVLSNRRDVPTATILDVFDRDGLYLGPIELSRAVDPRPGVHVSGERIYVVSRDSLGLQTITSLRWERPSG